ncbi:MAG TPA: DUF3237 family protein [Gammaproteobacteria bacterium]|nr:DUF3237 family protein [Gammaproteobacteria bacterium]
MRHPKSLLSLAALLLSTGALAQDDAGKRWPVPGVTPPGTELAAELFVTISPAVTVGPSDHGTRRFIPITGGRFTGNGIKGEVMAGGADWQLSRPDGVTEVNALYSIKTDDGAVIVVDNRGIIVPGNGGIGYARTNPQFHAPQGKYEWLNKTLFVGTITPATQGGAVIIRVFKVL